MRHEIKDTDPLERVEYANFMLSETDEVDLLRYCIDGHVIVTTIEFGEQTHEDFYTCVTPRNERVVWYSV
jgi:hypothetical protein